MRLKYLLPLFAVLLCSCAPLIQNNSSERHIPTIGDMGSYSKSLMNSDFQKIGNPNLKEPIAVSVTEVPFTKAKFKKFVAIREGIGKKPMVAFVDSLPNKPKYLCLELSDKIGMQMALNNSDNKAVRSYLEKGEDHKLVYKIAIAGNSEETALLAKADVVSLMDDKFGNLTLEMLQGNRTNHLNISKLAVFDYEVLGFCWGESAYGEVRIQTLTHEGQKCPKNTERNAYKLDEAKEYLKL